ncbi:MAG: hypothetical protein CO108_07550 [Deltaproteobacteria bacterium CG_4_9_14_3_um_filter_63_12]|nr:MAG: hypothetical protein CO108_07550 [Deltaproteobacteria bacterium CG_4_9_14_3_um_filter_63_12]
MTQPMNHTRLELSQFSDAARKHVDPASPPPLRMMGAKMMAPLSPNEMIPVLYQLTLDPEKGIREAAAQSLKDMPADLVSGVVSLALDARVLDLLGQTFVLDHGLMETLSLNQAVDDQTIAFIASKTNERVAEMIANFHVRLMRSPIIIEALYLNPNTRMSTVDKILDLAKRNNIALEGLPGLEEAIKDEDYAAGKQAIDDRLFANILHESVAEDKELDERIEALLEGEEPETEDEKKRVGRWMTIQNMNPAQKIRLAILGNAEDRNILVRDARRVVHMAAIQSPKITPGEATKLAGNRSMPNAVVEFIAKKRDWTRYYPVLVSLVNNPKTPFHEAIGFLKQLRPHDLSALQRNKNVPAQLSRQARELHRAKSGADHGNKH